MTYDFRRTKILIKDQQDEKMKQLEARQHFEEQTTANLIAAFDTDIVGVLKSLSEQFFPEHKVTSPTRFEKPKRSNRLSMDYNKHVCWQWYTHRPGFISSDAGPSARVLLVANKDTLTPVFFVVWVTNKGHSIIPYGSFSTEVLGQHFESLLLKN